MLIPPAPASQGQRQQPPNRQPSRQPCPWDCRSLGRDTPGKQPLGRGEALGRDRVLLAFLAPVCPHLHPQGSLCPVTTCRRGRAGGREAQYPSPERERRVALLSRTAARVLKCQQERLGSTGTRVRDLCLARPELVPEWPAFVTRLCPLHPATRLRLLTRCYSG